MSQLVQKFPLELGDNKPLSGRRIFNLSIGIVFPDIKIHQLADSLETSFVLLASRTGIHRVRNKYVPKSF